MSLWTSIRDSVVPIAGSVVGGYFGGPAGAAAGASLGTAAEGGSTRQILGAGALGYAGASATGMQGQGFGSLSDLFSGGLGGGSSTMFALPDGTQIDLGTAEGQNAVMAWNAANPDQAIDPSILQGAQNSASRGGGGFLGNLFGGQGGMSGLQSLLSGGGGTGFGGLGTGNGSGSTLASLIQAATGIYGINAAKDLQKQSIDAAAAADTFRDQRPRFNNLLQDFVTKGAANIGGGVSLPFYYKDNPLASLATPGVNQVGTNPLSRLAGEGVAGLESLQANPSDVTKLPGYQAGLEAVERAGASQGFTGSGNMMAALQQYGGQAYQNQFQNLIGEASLGGQAFNQDVTNYLNQLSLGGQAFQQNQGNLLNYAVAQEGTQQQNMSNVMKLAGADFNNAPAASQIGLQGGTNALALQLLSAGLIGQGAGRAVG